MVYATSETEVFEGGLTEANQFLQIAQLKGLSSLALVGLSKNAGKTTCLNHLIHAWKESGSSRALALTSIGRDGEEEDVVSGHSKPRIFVYSGTYLATAKSSLNRCDALLDVLKLSGIQTNFGEVVICRALSDGYVELAGPSQAAELLACESLLREQEPNLFFVIDGALSRRAQAGGGLTEVIILAVGAETSAKPEELAEITSHALNLLSIPGVDINTATRINKHLGNQPEARVLALPRPTEVAGKILALPTLAGQGRAIAELLDGQLSTLVLRGALTETLAKNLLAEKGFQDLKLVVEDGTRLFISATSWRKMSQKGIQLAALHPILVRMVCLNPFKADGSPADRPALLRALRNISPVPVEDFGPALG